MIKYKNKDTTVTRRDPNNNIYLAIHRSNLLIQDLQEARDHLNNIVDEEINAIRIAQRDLGYELPENYSPLWHLESDQRRLINNNTGFYQDP